MLVSCSKLIEHNDRLCHSTNYSNTFGSFKKHSTNQISTPQTSSTKEHRDVGETGLESTKKTGSEAVISDSQESNRRSSSHIGRMGEPEGGS